MPDDEVTSDAVDAMIAALKTNSRLYLAEKKDKALAADTQRAAGSNAGHKPT